MKLISQKVGVVRYTNGTLVKLTPSATSFQSTNYDSDVPTTYHPDYITIEGDAQGDLSISSWEYSHDGIDWFELVDGEKGVVISGDTVTIHPTDSLFSANTVIVRANGSNPEYYDTVTITREVSPVYVYDSLKTAIGQTDDKISLIASEEQLAQFTESATMVNKMASIETKADNITTLVTESYATKEYAEDYADDVVGDLATSTTTRFAQVEQTVSGITSTVATKVGNDEIISKINQSAEQVSINANKVNLNGAVIVERINDTTASVSIDANKINLNGAVTANNYFKINNDGSFETIMGLIGAIHIVANALFSGSHDSATSANDGFYLGADGSVSIGNGTNYIRWTKNNQNQFVLDVRLPSLKIGGSDAATRGDVTTALNSANTYSDGVLTTAQGYADGKATEALNSANSATDNKLHGYATTGDLEDAISDSETTAAETYQTQADASTDLAEAKTYAEGQASAAESNAKTYAQGQASTALTSANSYTDGKHTTAMAAASDAAKTATNYIYYDSTNGLVVSETGTADGNSTYPYNTQIKAGSIDFRHRAKTLARVSGSEFRINRGTTEKRGMTVSASDLSFYKNDGETVAANIGTGGLDVKSGTIGGFQITSTAKSATTENGGHLYKDSFFVHTSDTDYEYELGIRGDSSSRGTSGLYVARIDKGASWTTSNATLLTNLLNDGTFKTVKALIGGWTVESTRIYAKRLYLESGAGGSDLSRIVFGTYQKQSGAYRATAKLDSSGAASLKSVIADEIYVGDEMYTTEEITASTWNKFSATRNGIWLYNLEQRSVGATPLTIYNNKVMKATSSSSIRYKDVSRRLDDEDVKDAYDLQPVIAKYKDWYLDKDDPLYGKEIPMFIAEEVAETVPDAVIYNSEGLVEDWNHRVIIPVQHRMIVEQKKRIDALEKELSEIKALLKEVLAKCE